jgi:hypothetical protein
MLRAVVGHEGFTSSTSSGRTRQDENMSIEPHEFALRASMSLMKRVLLAPLTGSLLAVALLSGCSAGALEEGEGSELAQTSETESALTAPLVWQQSFPVTFSCGAGRSCQNVWDFDVPGAAVLDMQVTGVPNTRLSIELYAPGVRLGGTNMFTNSSSGRRCAPNGNVEKTTVLGLSSGRYRAAVTFNAEDSTGATSGSYTMTFRSSVALTPRGQTVSNGARVQGRPSCGWSMSLLNQSWQCATGTACVDTFNFSSELPSRLTTEIRNVTGRSLPRLAIRRTPNVNELNGLRSDRQCVNLDQTDRASTPGQVAAGNVEFSFGRSTGQLNGTYAALVSSVEPLTFRGQTRNDASTNFATSCP